MAIKEELIIYHSNLNEIGGVETFTHNFCQQLRKKYNIKLLIKQGSEKQLARIKKYVDYEEYRRQPIVTDILILSTAWGETPTTIKAKKVIQLLHADYEYCDKKQGWKYKLNPMVDEYVAVSQHVADTFERIYGIKPKVLYNIMGEKKPTKPILKLVSATRLTPEKGYERMKKLARKLQEAKIPFIWKVFTNTGERFAEEVMLMKPTYDIFSHITEADYGVQLSDTEGCPYFINECLQYGTPCIVTDFPSAKEFIQDGENGYLVDMNLSNINLNKILNEIPNKFKYEEKTNAKDWVKIIKAVKVKKDKPKIKQQTGNTTLIVNKAFTDAYTGENYKKGQEIYVSEERAEELLKHPSRLVEKR